MIRLVKKHENSFIISCLFFAFYLLLFHKIDQYSSSRFTAYFVACAALVILSIYLFINSFNDYRNKQFNKYFFYFASLFFLIAIFLPLDWILELNVFSSNRKFKFGLIFFQLLYIFIIVGYKLIKNIFKQGFLSSLFKKEKIKIYQIISAVLYISLIIFLINPIRLYATSPGELEIPLLKLLIFCFVNFAVIFIILFFIAIIIPGFFKKQLMVFFYFLAAFIFFYTFIFPGNFGALDNLILRNAENLYGQFYRNLIEVFFIILLWHFILFLINHEKIKILAISFFILSAVASAESLIISVKGKGFISAQVTSVTNEGFLPAYNSRMMGYTKTGKNIVVIFLDAMNGGYVPRLMEEIPEVMEKYKGFVWYPNALTISDRTPTSVSAMYGGWSYSPLEINKGKSKKTLIDIISESYEVLPNLLKEKNYVTSYTNPEFYMSPNGDVDVLNKKGIIAGFNRDYIPYWNYKNRESQESDNTTANNMPIRLITMISLFKVSPFLLKPIIYDDGDWLIIEKDEIINKGYRFALEHWAFLDLMKDVSNADENNNAFKYFHNNITHPPFAMSRDGILLRDEYPDPSSRSDRLGDNAYFSYKAAFEAISRWMDWLKKEEIYDNTMIILVSDHGFDNIKNPMLPDDFKIDGINDKSLKSAQVLFMVKKFNSNEDIKTDWRLMSNADVPALICNAAGISNTNVGEDPTLGEAWKNRVLDTMSSSEWRWLELVRHTYYNIYWQYKVKNNFFDDKNWEKVK